MHISVEKKVYNESSYNDATPFLMQTREDFMRILERISFSKILNIFL